MAGLNRFDGLIEDFFCVLMSCNIYIFEVHAVVTATWDYYTVSIIVPAATVPRLTKTKTKPKQLTIVLIFQLCFYVMGKYCDKYMYIIKISQMP